MIKTTDIKNEYDFNRFSLVTKVIYCEFILSTFIFSADIILESGIFLSLNVYSSDDGQNREIQTAE